MTDTTTTAADALRLHLWSGHGNLAAQGLTDDEAIDQHHHEHHGPGGIHNHDLPADLHNWANQPATTTPDADHVALQFAPKVIAATDREGDQWRRFSGPLWEMVDNPTVTAMEPRLIATYGPMTPTAWAGNQSKVATGANLIGPLTAEEWASFRLTGADDDPLQCCGNTSDLRDAIFDTLRMGAGPDEDLYLRDVWHIVEEHDGLAEHPLIAKLHAYYVAGKDPLPPTTALARLLAIPASYIPAFIKAAPEAWDLTTLAGRHTALGRIGAKVAYIVDDQERGQAAADLAEALSLPVDQVDLVVNAWRGNAGLLDAPTRSVQHGGSNA